MSDNYQGNPNLKKLGIPIEYTKEQILEIKKCSEDYKYFINTYCYIINVDNGLQHFELWDFQKEYLDIVHENRKILVKFPRQSSKTTTAAAYFLWYTLFNDDKTIAILANKLDAAIETLSRYQLMYENLPIWLQQGVKTWNKGSIELENRSKIFVAATTASGIRGKSCVTSDTKVCVEENDSIYYTEIYKLLNNSKFIDINDNTIMEKYSIYKTVNKINNKIYIGFHKIDPDKIITNKSMSGSIFYDGYLGSGKLIKRAISKYGPENFYQELINIFDSKEEAENFERNIVNKDFTLRDDTYNVSIGGNVRIMYGKNGGFYGKTHTSETIEKFREMHKGNKYASNANNFKIRNIETGQIYLDSIELIKSESHIITHKHQLIKLIGQGIYEFVDPDRQTQALNLFQFREKRSKEANQRKRNDVSKRFKGVPKSEEHRAKIGSGSKNFIKNNPEKHKQRMDKINKNPEKIEKTAQFHRGRKRTIETRKKISAAITGMPSSTKDKVAAHHIETHKIKYFNSINDIPCEYIRGYPPDKYKNKGILYNNGSIQKFFKNEVEVPSDFIKGGLSKPRKIK